MQSLWSERAETQSSIALPAAQPVEVSLAYQVCASKRDGQTIQLGAAVPSAADLFPLTMLNRLMSQIG